ncbi:MAG: diaminopimelate dehydrogenase [Firmicutes bacterium]|nr:diaminopimelate dehydrogenase [Bacillota bacterium]MDD4693291.1 diaminopimelate dehydrogenase [Bacillota bacterium]
MTKLIQIGIVGYGNLGKGALLALEQNKDMELVGVFSRRDPSRIKTETKTPVYHISDICKFQNKIDVMILCGGSATDLPKQGPEIARLFNTIDSFDTHAKIPEYFQKMDEAARSNGKTSIISVGWDPGLFSIMRTMTEAILPDGDTYTFWGKGVSQGHSDAIRRVEGVKGAIQYTIPIEGALNRVRSGQRPDLKTGEKHLRECFVVAEEGSDKSKIEETIKKMPNYFADYTTIVHFISEEELKENHAKMPHGGFVIRSGQTERESSQIVEFSLNLASNPGFTSSVLVAYARAAFRLNKEGQVGAKSVLDVAPSYLSPKSNALLRKELL